MAEEVIGWFGPVCPAKKASRKKIFGQLMPFAARHVAIW
jgi:hypothetical protein